MTVSEAQKALNAAIEAQKTAQQNEDLANQKVTEAEVAYNKAVQDEPKAQQEYNDAKTDTETKRLALEDAKKSGASEEDIEKLQAEYDEAQKDEEGKRQALEKAQQNVISTQQAWTEAREEAAKAREANLDAQTNVNIARDRLDKAEEEDKNSGSIDPAGFLNVGVLGATIPALELLINTPALQTVVNAWLSFGTTPLTNVVRIGAILANGALSFANNPLAYTGSGDMSYHGSQAAIVTREILGGGVMNTGVAQFINTVVSYTQQPNIEGIMIYAEEEHVSRESEVSEDPLIVQSDIGATQFVTDTANPHPRTIRVNGHIMSNSSVDWGLILKPSIETQVAFLDACMLSRRCVWYKTHYNKFIKCLITNFEYSYDPKTNNAIQVQVTLKEFVPLLMDTAATLLATATPTDGSAITGS